MQRPAAPPRTVTQGWPAGDVCRVLGAQGKQAWASEILKGSGWLVRAGAELEHEHYPRWARDASKPAPCPPGGLLGAWRVWEEPGSARAPSAPAPSPRCWAVRLCGEVLGPP